MVILVEGDPEPKPRRRNHLLGLGLDGGDGHRRVTKGEHFHLVGGSAETHERMTETVLKTAEELRRKGKDIGGANPAEVVELLDKHRPR